MLTKRGGNAVSMLAGRAQSIPMSPQANAVTSIKNATASPHRKLTDEQVIVAAVNDIEESSPGVVQLTHPLHRANLTAEKGLTFTPNGSASPWNWQLRYFGGERQSWINSSSRQIPARRFEDNSFGFDYGLFVERYVPRAKTLEQQFVILKKPHLMKGEDLVICGKIESGEATFEEHRSGWVWRDPLSKRVTSMGGVYVYDAEGDALPATMEVEANKTAIYVDGGALLAATYPVTVDPEIGVDDFGISYQAYPDMQFYDARSPRIAYSAENQIAMVVWLGTLATGAREVFGVQCDGATGKPLSDPFRVSSSSANGDPQFGASRPDVTFDQTTQRFVVVWSARKEGHAEGHCEIYSRRYSTSAIPSDVFQISIVKHPNTPDVGSVRPVVEATGNGEALVAWTTKENVELGVFSEVRARMISTAEDRFTGNSVLLNQPARGDEPDDQQLAVIFHPEDRQFLVGWNRAIKSAFQDEVLVRRIGRNSGTLTLIDSAPISIGHSRSNQPDISDIHFAFNPRTSHYLVTWSFFSGSEGVALGQLLDRSAQEIGQEFEIAGLDATTTGSDVSFDHALDCFVMVHFFRSDGEYCVLTLAGADPAAGVQERSCVKINPHTSFYDSPAIVSTSAGRMLVVYADAEPRVHHEHSSELFTQTWTIPSSGVPESTDSNYFISKTAAPSPSGSFEAFDPDVAFVEERRNFGWYVVVWSGDGNLRIGSPSATEELEIFARQIDLEGMPAGNPVRLTRMGDDGDTSVDAIRPRIVVRKSKPNTTETNIFIVFQANGHGDTAPSKSEIYGLFTDRAGVGLSHNVFRISETGQDDQGSLDAVEPAVAWDSVRNRFLVAWRADGPSLLRDDHFSIKGALIRPPDRVHGLGTIERTLRISPSTTVIPSEGKDASPAIAFDGVDEYLVTYAGTLDLGDGRGMQRAIWARKIDDEGDVVHSVFERVSIGHHAENPDIAFNPDRHEFCVVWEGNPSTHSSIPPRILGQRLTVNTTQRIGHPSFDISHTATTILADTEVRLPRIAYVSESKSYLVVWSGRERRPHRGAAIGSRRIFAQQIGGDREFLMSNLWLSDQASAPQSAGIAAGMNGEVLAIWQGLDDRDIFAHTHYDIYGQLYQMNTRLDAEVSIDEPHVMVDFQGEAGVKYVVEASTNLLDWIFLTPGLVPNQSGTVSIEDAHAFREFDQRFYRVTRKTN